MLDYVRWVFRLDFCTPRYIMIRELGLKSLKVEWGIRAMRYENRCREKGKENFTKMCWEEKDEMEVGKKDNFSKERESFYNKAGWGVEEINRLYSEKIDVESIITERWKDIQNQIIDSRIRNAKYNKRYKEIEVKGGRPRYLMNESINKLWIGDGVRALIRLRCGNMEIENRYWKNEEDRKCIFCELGRDDIEHYVGECKVTENWFIDLGKNKKEKIRKICNDEMQVEKGRILNKLWKEKEKKWREIKNRENQKNNNIESEN